MGKNKNKKGTAFLHEMTGSASMINLDGKSYGNDKNNAKNANAPSHDKLPPGEKPSIKRKKG